VSRLLLALLKLNYTLQNITKYAIIIVRQERRLLMGAVLFTQGLLLTISIAVMIVCSIVGFFIGNIILFESVGIAIAAGCLANHFLHIHPAFCLLIGIGVLVGLTFLMKTKIGFWLIGGMMSLLWGLLVAVFVYSGTNKDMVWTYVSWGLATLAIFGLHLYAKSRNA